jgi:hypothetical protein
MWTTQRLLCCNIILNYLWLIPEFFVLKNEEEREKGCCQVLSQGNLRYALHTWGLSQGNLRYALHTWGLSQGNLRYALHTWGLTLSVSEDVRTAVGPAQSLACPSFGLSFRTSFGPVPNFILKYIARTGMAPEWKPIARYQVGRVIDTHFARQHCLN